MYRNAHTLAKPVKNRYPHTFTVTKNTTWTDKHIHTHNQPNKDLFEKPEKNILQHTFIATQNRTKKNTHTLTPVSYTHLTLPTMAVV